MVKPEDIELRLGCDACPEAYDAYLNDKMVGYLRLRGGRFTVDCPNYGATRMYEAHHVGYEGKGGQFLNDVEREYHLSIAKQSITSFINYPPNDKKAAMKRLDQMAIKINARPDGVALADYLEMYPDMVKELKKVLDVLNEKD